jgi:hypothetical protein
MRKTILQIIVLLFITGCVTLTNKSVESAILNQEYSKLELILSDIQANNGQPYKDISLKIESYLAKDYYHKGNLLSEMGDLNGALLYYKKALNFQNSDYIQKAHDKLNDTIKILNNLIRYFASSDTSNYHYQVNKLNSFSDIRYPINKKQYLNLNIDNNFYYDILQIENILNDKKKNEFEKYVSFVDLYEYSSLRIRRKIESFQTVYEKYLFDSDFYLEKANRLLMLKFIDSSSTHNFLQEKNKYEIKKILMNYYNHSFQLTYLNLNDIYECYLVNNLFPNTFDISNLLKKYIDSHSYEIVIAKPINDTIRRISDNLIGSDIQFKYAPSGCVNNEINISLIVTSLDIDIDIESYRKKIYSEYISAVYEIPNDSYDIAVMEAEQAERELNREVSRQPSNEVYALLKPDRVRLLSSKYQLAKMLASMTPKMKSVNTYSTYNFDEIGHSIYGQLYLNLCIRVSGDIVKTIPIEIDLKENRKSYVGVKPSDQKGHSETHIKLPSVSELQGNLIERATKEIVCQLTSQKISSYTGQELFNINQISDCVLTYKSSEFKSFIRSHFNE